MIPIVGTHKATFEKFYRVIKENPQINNLSDIIPVYMTYIFSGVWQDTNKPHATISYLSTKLGISVDRVRYAKKILAELNLIEDIPAYGTKQKAFIKINHFLRHDTLINYQQEEPEIYAEDGSPTNLPQKKKPKEKSEREEELEIMFEEFWKEYPRKVGKPKAKKTFLALKPSDDLYYNSIIPGLEAWKKTPDWIEQMKTADKSYLPHATTWINDKRWEGITFEDNSEDLELANQLFLAWGNGLDLDLGLHIKNERTKSYFLKGAKFAKKAFEIWGCSNGPKEVEKCIARAKQGGKDVPEWMMGNTLFWNNLFRKHMKGEL